MPEPTDPPSARLAREAVAFLPDAARALYAAVRDPRVPGPAKVQAAGLLALAFGPWDSLPVVGPVGVVTMAALAARRLVTAAGEEVLREHWTGSDAGFRVFLALARSGGRPGRLAWHLAGAVRKPDQG